MPAQVDVTVAASARRWIRLGLFSAIPLFVGLSTAVEISKIVFHRETLLGFAHMFALGDEGNAPTWYSSTTFLVAGLIAGAIAVLHHHERNALARQWVLFAGLLVLMSLDETASIHEMGSIVTFYVLRGDPANIPWYIMYAWVVPGALVLAGVAWWCSRLWAALPTVIRRQFTTAAAVFFGGALGLEFGEAAWFARFGSNNTGYSAIWTLQETCEMVGVALLILALFDYLVLRWTSVTIRLPSDGRA